MMTRTVTFLAALFFTTWVPASEFPLREIYRSVATIEHAELAQRAQEFSIVDVRSKYEYDTLHIAGAVHISMSNAGFINKLEQLRAARGQPIVFYCNGITCAKSYLASIKAMSHGIDQVRTFDLGVQRWAQHYPERTVLLAEPMRDSSALITDEQFIAHSLLAPRFHKMAAGDVMLLDIREPIQRDLIIFADRARLTPLDRVGAALKQARRAGVPLLIFDAVGKQVRWLQYRLQREKFEDYYFLRGGVRAYAKEVLGQ
ncbi:MAG: rhodanese-like domain-containing protein [Pseudomonadales bacterium]